MTPSNANTSGMEVVGWEARLKPDGEWFPLLEQYVAARQKDDAVEVRPSAVTAASAQAEREQYGRWLVAMANDRDAAEARADRLAKALEDIENVADSFCDDSADLLAGQIRIRTRAALQQETQP